MSHEDFDKLTGEEIRKHMANLTQYPAWKVFSYIIERDEIEPLKEKLLTGKFETLEEVKAAQERLCLAENIVYSPESEIASLTPDNKQEDERN